LDALFETRPDLQNRRVFLKIDTDGMEAEVLAGARSLLESGRVAAVIWSRGRRYDKDPDRSRFLESLSDLTSFGFRHFRLPHDVMGGALVPYVYGHEICNIFSLNQGFQRKDGYSGSTVWSAPPRPSSVTLPRTARIQWTELLMANRASDAGRWADPANLKPGANERARLATKHVPSDMQLLDLGGGLSTLQGLMEESSAYVSADLTPRGESTIICDLNQGRWPENPPEGYYDIACMLGVLEYLHDPAAALARARGLAERLLLVYKTSDGQTKEDRRASGYFNDMTEVELKQKLNEAGWRIVQEDAEGDYKLYRCEAD